MPAKLLYTTAEACELLNVGKTKLFDLLRSGELNSIRIGSARLVPSEDLADFVARLRGSRGPEPERLQDLMALIDDDGNFDIERIPEGCMVSLADLKRAVAERRLQSA